MRPGSIAFDAVRNLARQPLRTLLTASASAVAIAVTVNVISLVYGLDEDLRRDTARMGRRTVDVARLPVLVPGRKRAALGEAQRETVDQLVRGLGCVVVPRRLVSGSAVGAGQVESLGVVAVSPDYPTTLDVPIAAGRFFADDDPDDGVCVLDESLAAGLFPGVPVADVPGRSVRLTLPGGTGERRVVGVLSDPLTHRALFEAFDEGRDARTLTSALLSFRNLYVPEGALTG